ncbi:MAG: hypothetical protein HOQ24_05680, partial [Mycobacteriaceae bacterium]|nr:hypothetical protein [Mycobacteriaceae bacterium]
MPGPIAPTDAVQQLLDEMPTPIQWAVFGGDLPKMRVGAMRRLEDAWRSCGDVWNACHQRTVTGAGQLISSVAGGAGDSAYDHVRQLAVIQTKQRDFCYGIADQCRQAAADTEKSLWEMAVFGVIVAYQVAFLVSSGGVGAVPGIALLSKARATFLQMLEKCVFRLGLEGAGAAAARVGLLGGAFGLGSAALDLGIQEVQVLRGNRARVDTKSVAAMGLQGMGAVAGGHVGGTLSARAAPFLGRAALPVAAAAGGVAGVFAGSAAAMPVTGQFHLTGSALLGGLSQGLAGGLTAVRSHQASQTRAAADGAPLAAEPPWAAEIWADPADRQSRTAAKRAVWERLPEQDRNPAIGLWSLDRAAAPEAHRQVNAAARERLDASLDSALATKFHEELLAAGDEPGAAAWADHKAEFDSTVRRLTDDVRSGLADARPADVRADGPLEGAAQTLRDLYRRDVVDPRQLETARLLRLPSDTQIMASVARRGDGASVLVMDRAGVDEAPYIVTSRNERVFKIDTYTGLAEPLRPSGDSVPSVGLYFKQGGGQTIPFDIEILLAGHDSDQAVLAAAQASAPNSDTARAYADFPAAYERLTGSYEGAQRQMTLLLDDKPQYRAMPFAGLAGVRGYTVGAYWPDMNAALWSGEPARIAKYESVIRAAEGGLAQLPPHKGRVERGVAVDRA